MRIEGMVHGFADRPGRSGHAVARIVLQDVSTVDASAVAVAGIRIDDVIVSRGLPLAVEFAFDVDDDRLDPRSSYIVFAHIDLDGDGNVTSGDYVTTESVGVRPAPGAGRIEVPVRAVR